MGAALHSVTQYVCLHVRCFLFVPLLFYFCSVPPNSWSQKTPIHLKVREWHFPWHCCQRNSTVCWFWFVLRQCKDIISLSQEPFFISKLPPWMNAKYYFPCMFQSEYLQTAYQTVSACCSLKSLSFHCYFDFRWTFAHISWALTNEVNFSELA